MAPTREGPVQVRGELVSLRQFGTSGWGIGEVRVGDELVAVKGTWLDGVAEGQPVEVTGKWEHHPKHGLQINARSIDATRPTSTTGVVAWLAKLPHLGPKRATDLVERFGVEGLWEVIETAPDRLLEVDGLTPKRRDEIVGAYAEEREDRDRQIRFRNWGFTDGQIKRVLEKWGDNAEKLLRDDPYELAKEVPGFGFLRADQIARRMGLAPDSPARVRAALRYTLESAASDAGHVYLTTGMLVSAVRKRLLPGIDPALIRAGLAALVRIGDVVDRQGWLYLSKLDRAEGLVADAIIALLLAAPVNDTEDFADDYGDDFDTAEAAL